MVFQTCVRTWNMWTMWEWREKGVQHCTFSSVWLFPHLVKRFLSKLQKRDNKTFSIPVNTHKLSLALCCSYWSTDGAFVMITAKTSTEGSPVSSFPEVRTGEWPVMCSEFREFSWLPSFSHIFSHISSLHHKKRTVSPSAAWFWII